MEQDDPYTIPKATREVTLWIHPEQRVAGSLFLSLHTPSGTGGEGPCDVLNAPAPFLVLRGADREEPGFYSKRAIVRVEYEDADPPLAREGSKTLGCQLLMMDGSLIEGTVRYALPPTRERLYDYLNLAEEGFITLHREGHSICLVNKAYVVCASQLSAGV